MMVELADETIGGLEERVWQDVVSAMDRTYTELVAYQELLENQNREIDDMRQFMASVLSSVSDILLVVGKNREIERTGGAFREILGRDEPATGTLQLEELLAEDAGNTLSASIDDVMRDREPRVVEAAFRTATGPTPLEVSISARLDDRGRSRGAVLVGRPLGELRNAYRDLEASHVALKQAQSQLVRNEKLASIGRLVAGVAHELNNPISFVYANTHALAKYTTRLETYFTAVQDGRPRSELAALRQELHLDRTVRNLREAINGAKDGAERVRDIVEDLRRLSADGAGENAPFDLVQMARTAAEWVMRGTQSAVLINYEGEKEVTAFGNRGHIQQIAMNLVQNAIDALQDVPAPLITLNAYSRDGKAVLEVIDNGPGIAPEVAAAIFDPFYTTKEVGKGTGLGLAISHKIAEEHGGSLTLARTGLTGSCFALSLPEGGSR